MGTTFQRFHENYYHSDKGINGKDITCESIMRVGSTYEGMRMDTNCEPYVKAI